MVKWRQIRVTQEQIDRLRNECKTEFLEHHPEFSSMPLSDNFMLTKIIDWYLDILYTHTPPKTRRSKS